MEISGKIIAILPLQSGTGRNGTEWKKQDYVVETHDQYPKKMCFNLWGDRIDQFTIQMGEEVTVSFDIDCREWNGKWFNDIRAWKIDRNSGAGVNAQPMQQSAPVEFTATDAKDDLPF
ncbi:DUF3127 domain-containing protein [uncultured Bacteroides sp.]|jgi:Protein of unknown function (DUF3127).|uniref:DUF3127 domain-containing protein n=1 Tax=uncultured Bacteroides sp. TaxID=162156 RepID=UPI002AAB20C0|nr:DUF3127 domain-containing protein [uncultured Bacteroides sp.]